jgi:MFS transporter, PAT family, beta-lactamase induction signal transducer AmpG
VSDTSGDGARGWRAALRLYSQPRMLTMLLLGFSAGLPFYLVFQTLSAWLRQSHVERSTIGMLAWVGTVYSLKFLWAPVVDRVSLPLLTRALGRRRSWMLLAQLGIGVGLVNLSVSDPSVGVTHMALWALFVAFCAATQDISIDAWRIESAAVAQQGAMAAAYQIGYRVALITASAGAFTIADHYGWRISYTTMALLVGVGVVTTLLAAEPRVALRDASLEREQRVADWLARRAHWPRSLQQAGAWFVSAVVCPLLDFFSRYGGVLAVVTLLFMGSYRLTEFTMGSMSNSFYIDRGYTLSQIAAVVKLYGLAMSLVGVVIAGFVIARLGLLRSLIAGSLMIMLSNVGFSLLARAAAPTLLELGLVNGFDNLAQAMHGTALIAFLSSLTSARYTATQYALFSSLYALPGKILEGLSGFVVDAIGYSWFFLYTASLSVPALLLLWYLAKRGQLERVAAPASGGGGN